MGKDQHAHKLCFGQLRIISGCNLARLASNAIACLNRSKSVTFERSVGAAGGTKSEGPRNQNQVANRTVSTWMDRVQQHVACTTLPIKEGCSLWVGTPPLSDLAADH